MEEGWYLMSLADLEIELARWRGDSTRPPSNAQPLSIDEALAFRNEGNFPDDLDRTLRLVLRIDNDEDLHSLDSKRLAYEPDFYESPAWRRAGSKPVNVVPLRRDDVEGSPARPWWEDPTMAAMEREWAATGRVDGIRIPGQYRGFIYKTIALLRSAGAEVTVDAIAGSIERWLAPDQAARLRSILQQANRAPQPPRGQPPYG
jgi:hypothetical protein